MKKVYLDYASTTPLDPRVLQEMNRYFDIDFGNVGAIHNAGVLAKRVLEDSRKKVASVLSSKSDEVIFTGSGTESNNLAIFGTVIALRQEGVSFKNMHFVTSTIEHSSVLECFKALKRRGASVSFIDVGPKGIVNPKFVASALKSNTVLVSIMYANNEIGTIQPIREISKIVRANNFKTLKPARTYQSPFGTGGPSNFRTRFHSDGSQAPLYLPLNTESLGVDLLTLDGHKIYGPKGVGVLYVSRGISLAPIMVGGGQEKGLRPGTENIPLIVGLAKALELSNENRVSESARLIKLRDYTIDKILKFFPEAILNGARDLRLPNNINFSFPGVDTEFLVIQMDARGIATSTKSSCLSGEPGSYVVKALGGDDERSRSTLRISLGKNTKKADLDHLLKCLVELVGSKE